MKRYGLGLVLLVILGGCNLTETLEREELAAQADDALRLEAAAFDMRPGESHTWRLRADEDAADGKVLRALPDIGKNYKKDYADASPRLDHALDMPAGTYYVWVRGRAAEGKTLSSNSLHIGINGEPKVEHVGGFEEAMGWSNLTMREERVKLNVPEGKQTLNVWMREDGFSLDSLFLTRDEDEKPSRTANVSRGPSAPLPNVGPGVRAKRADDFVDSIGVNTHLQFTDTVYRNFEDLIEPKLVKLGVRHLRDGAYTSKGHSANHPYYKKCRALASEGIRFNLLVNVGTSYVKATDFSKLDDVVEWCDGAVVSFEGLNEPDLRGGDWAKVTKDVQKKLYKAVKGDSDLSRVKVLGPSVVWKTDEVGDLSGYLDYGNWHPYSGGNCPSCTDPYGNGLDSYLPRYREPSGDKPMVMTETGYHNAVNMGATDHRPVSERAAATYIPRLFLEHFNRGFVRSYLYEFIDLYSDSGRDERDKNFGLLRNDGSEKPAYRALENLIDLLEDPGADFEPDALAYDLTGETDKVHSTLLQKEDGTFYLALWQARASYDTGARANAPDDVGARRDLSVSEQEVTLTVGTLIDEAALYILEDDGGLVKKDAPLEGGRLELDVSDTVTLVELTP